MHNSENTLSGFPAASAPIANMGHAVTDSELLAASQRGEHAAFGQLVTKYQALVCAVSFSGTRDAGLAEDVAQEAFVAAWHNLGQLRETSRFRSWLCGIARNLARKAKRRAQRETPDDTIADTALSAAASPFDHASEAQTAQLVQSALTRIPDRYREVLVLYYQQERSVRDVAEILDISEAAALQRLSRGRTYLAQHMSKLVEQSLERTRPRRDLAASVLAAIGPGAMPLPHASPVTSGGTMLKLALGISAALAATGATVWATHGSSSSSKATASNSAAATALPATAPVPAQHQLVAPTPDTPATTAITAAAKPTQLGEATDGGKCAADILEESRELNAATLASTNLYQGIAQGPANAPVNIVVFGDMQCQFCAKVLATIDQLQEEYPNKLRLVMKQFPLDGHEFAQIAAEATLAANAQGKYWPYHDLLMASQDTLSRDTIDAVAQQVGIDMTRFTRELNNHTYAAAVAADKVVATTLNVQGTPSFVINGHLFVGARPISEFRTLIDAELGPR